MRDQIIYNIVHSIWCDYNNLMRSIESMTPEEYTDYKNSVIPRLTDKINHHNHEAFTTLPHHALFVSHLSKSQGHRESSSGGLAVRSWLIQPHLSYSLNSLEHKFIDAYSNSWCKNSVFAHLVDSKPKFLPVLVSRHLNPPSR